MSDGYDWQTASIEFGDGEEGPHELSDVSVESISIDTSDISSRIARDAAAQFSEYLIDEAATTITVDAFDVDAVQRAAHELESEGYRVSDDPNDEGEIALGAATPELFATLQDDIAQRVRVHRDPIASKLKRIGVGPVDVRADPSLPEGMAIVIHPEIVVPTPPSAAMGMSMNPTSAEDVFRVSTRRPWNVRDPRGLVVVEVTDD